MAFVLIDTNVYLSAVAIEERDHEASRSFLHAIAKQPSATVILPRLVSIETYNVVERIRNKDKAERVHYALYHAQTTRSVDLDSAVELTARTLLRDVTLKSSDLIVLASAKLYDAMLVTLDKQLYRNASRIVPTYTPTQWLTEYNRTRS